MLVLSNILSSLMHADLHFSCAYCVDLIQHFHFQRCAGLVDLDFSNHTLLKPYTSHHLHGTVYVLFSSFSSHFWCFQLVGLWALVFSVDAIVGRSSIFSRIPFLHFPSYFSLQFTLYSDRIFTL